jgi:autotransporter translocation and assembly factor TamB
MTQNNPDPANQGSQPGKNDPPNESVVPTKPKKKKRWLVLKILIGLVAVIILLVLLAPTLISMGIVRDMVVGQINSSALNGKLQIKDWSFGWTSGVHIESRDWQHRSGRCDDQGRRF